MAKTRSLEEWDTLIDEVYHSLPKEYPTYSAPEPGNAEFAQFIDHTLLNLDATESQIDKLCEEAKKYQFKSVCVRPKWVARAVANLRSSSVLVCTVIGFHEGTYPTAVKVDETRTAVSRGATELDMVLIHPYLKSTPPACTAIYHDILAVRIAAPAPLTLKVILETSQLSTRDIVAACVIAEAAGADFVKTSTGFCGRGASVEDVRVMRSVVEQRKEGADKRNGGRVKVKASGGVRDIEGCLAVMRAGAERIGASAGVGILEEGRAAGGRAGVSPEMDVEAEGGRGGKEAGGEGY